MRKGIIILSVIAIMVLLFVASASQSSESKIAPLVFASVGEDGKIPVIIVLKEQPQLQGMMSRVEEINNLKSHAESTQRTLVQALRQEAALGNAEDINPFYITNAIAVRASPSTIKKMASMDEVERIEPDVRVKAVEARSGNSEKASLSNPFSDLISRPPIREYEPKDIERSAKPTYPNNTAWGVNWIEAPQLWKRSINGSGVNVSIIDTGIAPHPDIADRIIAFKDFVKNIPYNGSKVFYSGKGANLTNNMERSFLLGNNPSMELYGKYDLDYIYNYTTRQITYLDYGYVNISTDGTNWTNLRTFKGLSDGYLKEAIDLSPYRGQNVTIRFTLVTSNISYYNKGWYLDDIRIKDGSATTYFDGAEAGMNWDAIGWTIVSDNWPSGTMWYSGTGNNLFNTLDQTFNFSGLSIATLNFTTTYDTEACCDFGKVQVMSGSSNAWYSGKGNNLRNTLQRSFNLSSVINATINFTTWYNTESGYDYGYLQVSTDNGSTWTTLRTYNGQQSNIRESINLNSYVGNSNLLIRFYYYTDSSVIYEGWYVDDISLSQISFYDDVEGGAGDWVSNGWSIVRIGAWDTIATYSGYSAYKNQSFNLSAYAGRPNVTIRFLYTSDYSVNYEGWYVDEIRIPELSFYDPANTDGNWTAKGWMRAGPNTPYDDHGHGTHVAGTVAGNGKMGINTGVAPGANLMGAKVLDRFGSGYSSDIIKAIEWSYENNADVVSLSLGMLPWDEKSNWYFNTVNTSATVAENITVFSDPFVDSPFKTITPGAFQPTSIFGGIAAYTNNSVWETYSYTETYLKRTVNLSNTSSATLNFRTHFHIYGNAYVEASTDGVNWTALDSYTGSSHVGDNWWKSVSLNLSSYAGSNVTLRFYHPYSSYYDWWQVDDISIPQIGFYDDVEQGNKGWTASGWNIVSNYEPVNVNNLNISLTSPVGSGVSGDPVNWWYLEGKLPSNVWLYKYTGNNPLQAGVWNLTITSNYSRPVYYYYLLLVTYPSDGSDATSMALNQAADRGIVPVVAAGNEGDLGLYSIGSPGASGKAITVGATDYYRDYIAYFSSRGPVGFGANKTTKPDVVAPGVYITSLDTGNWYRAMSGTSMATPHTSGTVALMLQRNSSLTPEQVKQILMNSSIDLGAPGTDNTYGAGRISAYAAAANASSLPLPPIVQQQRPGKHELFAGATADDISLQPFISDATGDVADSSIDIRGASVGKWWVYSTDDYVEIKTYTASLPDLNNSEFYVYLDTDKNASTGLSKNDIGADYEIKINRTVSGNYSWVSGYLYKVNGSQLDFIQQIGAWINSNTGDYGVGTGLYLGLINQTMSTAGFYGVVEGRKGALTDTAPDSGHGVFPYANIPIKMVGISWNDTSGTPRAGMNLTFRVEKYNGYPYYNYTMLANITRTTDSNGMASVDVLVNQTETWQTFYTYVSDEAGNSIFDPVYVQWEGFYYPSRIPFIIPASKDYFAYRNETMPVKLTLVTPEWQPYNNNVTLVFGYNYNNPVVVENMTPSAGTIEYDLNLSRITPGNCYYYYCSFPVRVLNGTLNSSDFETWAGYVNIVDVNYTRIDLSPQTRAALPGEKPDFLVESYRIKIGNDRPVSRDLKGYAYWVKEVDVRALGEKLSPSILGKLDRMRKYTLEKGKTDNLLTKGEKEELNKALRTGIKNIGINYTEFNVRTDSTGIAAFNVTVPNENVYYGFIGVYDPTDESSYYSYDESFVFVRDPNTQWHSTAPVTGDTSQWLDVWVDWNAKKIGNQWIADNNYTANVNLMEYNSSSGIVRSLPGEQVYLYTTTRDTKVATTDTNGSARVNFTAPQVDITNSSCEQLCHSGQVQVWGITRFLQPWDKIAVANDNWGYIRAQGATHNYTQMDAGIVNNNLDITVRYKNDGNNAANVPSIIDAFQTTNPSWSYGWGESREDLSSGFVNSPTGVYHTSIPLPWHGTYSARSFVEDRSPIWKEDPWGVHTTGAWEQVTFAPFNITAFVNPRYTRNITQPITVSVRDLNGTPVQGASVYIVESTGCGGCGGGGGGGEAASIQQVSALSESNAPWGYIDIKKTDASGNAVLMLRTPDVNMAWVYYRIGGATNEITFPYIRSGSFEVRQAENRSDLRPMIEMPSVIEAGRATNITGRVYNYGDIRSNASNLSIFVNGVIQLPNVTIPPVNASDYISFSKPWTPVNATTYEIKAIVDNNMDTRSVIASLPDLTPTIITSPRLQLGRTADIGVIVRNIGGITAPASSLLVQINNSDFNTSAVPSILPGGMYSVHMNWTPAIVGTYTIKAISDATGIITELNELNNETTQFVDVFTLPDLTVSLTVPSDIRVNTPVNITANVRNIGSMPSNQTNLSVYDGAALLQNTSVSRLNASESRNYNVPWTPTTVGTAQIRAIIDPEGTTQESDKTNNVAIITRSVRFTDLAVTIQSRNEVILNSTETIRVVVRNIGTMASEPTGLIATINSIPVELINTTVPSIAPGDNRVFSATWNAAEIGAHTVNASLESKSSDINPLNDNATRIITVKGYNINVWYMWYPYYYPVYEDNYFYIGAYVDADYAGTANASISFDRPGLNVTMPNKTFTLYNSTYNYIWWLVRADEVGKYNATITVSGFNQTSSINTTQNKVSQIRSWGGLYNYTFYQYGPINVIAQTVVVKDLNWTIPPLNGTASGTLNYQVFNVTEIEKPNYYWWMPSEPNRSLKIELSAGAEGRMLMGLDYLFNYPNGCPEQTMSPTLGAKRVEQYYLKRGVLTEELNTTLYNKVKTGVNRMSPNSSANPQQLQGVGTGTGGWAWGTGTPSMFYTVYTHYGMGVILNNTNYSHLVYNANINVNESARWIVNNQNYEGSWTGSGYINGNVPMTGFTMIALEQTLPYMNATMYNITNNSLQNATAYLLRTQMSNGGWNQSYYSTGADGYSTALALLGLIGSGNNSAPVQQAISNGTGWLIANQDNRTGSWSKYPGSQSYSYYGDLAETTAYAAVALNKSGLSSQTNDSIRSGVRYLAGVYQDQGSWGSTKSSQTAIYALTELQVPEDVDTLVTIVLKDVINQSIRLNNTYPAATISSLQKPYLFRDRIWIHINRSELNAIGIGNHTINITTNGTAKVLVSVESKQIALKREAFARVPMIYIDPIADNFTLAMSLPSGIKDGDTITANATITNKDNTTGMYVMVLEVPFSSNVTFPNTYPENTTYYINNASKVLVQNMYNSSDNKLYIYPGSDDESQPSVPAGGSRSFYFNVTMLGYGQQTIESKVVPMYNDTLMAIANISTTVKGYGNVTVNTIDVNDSSIVANITIDSSTGTTARKLEGSYSLNATKPGFIPVNTTVSIAPGSDRIYTAKLVENASDPVAVFYETNTTALPANVSGVVTKVYNFTVQSNGGKTIIALQIPANHTFLSATVNGVSVSARNESGIVYVEAELTGDSVFEVRFKAPYVVGDFTGDDVVDFKDVTYLAKHYYGFIGYVTLRSPADFNRDGVIDFKDVTYLAKYYYGFIGYQTLNPL